MPLTPEQLDGILRATDVGTLQGARALLVAERDVFLAEREEMRAALRELAEEVKRCPRCGMSYCAVPEDHPPGCRLAALLGG